MLMRSEDQHWEPEEEGEATASSLCSYSSSLNRFLQSVLSESPFQLLQRLFSGLQLRYDDSRSRQLMRVCLSYLEPRGQSNDSSGARKSSKRWRDVAMDWSWQDSGFSRIAEVESSGNPSRGSTSQTSQCTVTSFSGHVSSRVDIGAGDQQHVSM